MTDLVIPHTYSSNFSLISRHYPYFCLETLSRLSFPLSKSVAVHAYYIISLHLSQNLQQSRTALHTRLDFHHLWVQVPLECSLRQSIDCVYEVAAISEEAASLLQESAAGFGLIFAVLLLVLLQFMESVCELAPLLVGTAPVLDESLAELGFLLGGARGTAGRLFGGEGVGVALGEEEGRSGGRDGAAGVEHEGELVLLIIICVRARFSIEIAQQINMGQRVPWQRERLGKDGLVQIVTDPGGFGSASSSYHQGLYESCP